MKTIIRSFCILGLLMAVFACNNGRYSEEIKQIDSLLVIQQQTELIMKQIDTMHAQSSRDTFALYWTGIREAIEANPDLVEVRHDPWWDYAMLYEGNDRSLKKLLRRYLRLAEKHRMNQTQLSALRTSVKKNQIPADSIPIYLITEGVEIQGVHREATVIVPEMKRTLEVLDSLHAFAGKAAAHYRELLPVNAK